MRDVDLKRPSLLPPGRDGPDLGARQSAFAAAILHPDRPVPPGLVGPDGDAGLKRYSVYRNNVVAGLVETLKAAFPAVRRLVADPFFSAMARTYVLCEPPGSPIMLDYSAQFPAFIASFEPAATLPYLGDVARLERAWAEAYHAAEAEPLDPAAFTTIAAERLPEIGLALHPSVRIVRSGFPVVALWRMNIDGGVPAPVDIDGGGEDALVVRPHAEVEVRTLPAGAASFIGALAAGASIAAALAAARLDDPRFDLAGALLGLIEAGAIVGWGEAERSVDDQRRRSE